MYILWEYNLKVFDDVFGKTPCVFLDVCNRILGLFRFSRTNYENEERDQSVLKMTGCIMFALYDFWVWVDYVVCLTKS